MFNHPYDISVSNPIAIEGTSPAAGAVYTFNIPDKQLFRINSITFKYTCSAAVANRYVYLLFHSGIVDPVWQTQAPFALTASTSMTFSYGISSPPPLLSATQARFTGSLPDYIRLTDTMFLQIRSEGIDAGDQISNISFHTDQWFDIARLH